MSTVTPSQVVPYGTIPCALETNGYERKEGILFGLRVGPNILAGSSLTLKASNFRLCFFLGGSTVSTGTGGTASSTEVGEVAMGFEELLLELM